MNAHDATPIPPDDPSRKLVDVASTDRGLTYIALAGDTYTVLVSGEDTAGRYTLIDMHIPPGGGPPSHRHDFEEMFSILEGEIVFTFRGETTVAGAGRTINIPANAPHHFRNASGAPARMTCMCSPAGQEKYFALVGDLVGGPTSQPPELSEAEKAARGKKALELAPRFRTEML